MMNLRGVLVFLRFDLEQVVQVVSELRTTVHELRAKLAAYERIGASPVTQAPMPTSAAPARPNTAPVAPAAPAPLHAPAPAAVPRPVTEQRDLRDTLHKPPVVPPTAPPIAATSRSSAGAAPPARPPAPPALPPRGPERRATPPAPPKPPFDWEKLIGVKLFSWIASAALALAAVFFLRYSMDHGWLRPEIRMGIGLVTGVALLIACELKVARRYAVTANAMDAAGIAILFATVFASYALWHLVPSVIAFALLVLVTSVAVLLSIRRESMFIALLGLLGGFSTPVLLSSGQDNPLGLFSYLLLLNGGLA